MLSWLTIIKMIFNFLKSFFGWADESSRKRHANEFDFTDYDYISPKRHCCEHNSMHNHRDVVELEDDDDELQTENEVFHSFHNNSTNSVRKRASLPGNNYRKKTTSILSFSKPNAKMATQNSKSRLNSRPSVNFRYSTLSKTQQLREKEQYGQMLQNLIPPRIQIVKSTPERRRSCSQRPVEVIDVENYEASTSKAKDCSTPFINSTRWFTPMTSLSKPAPTTRGKPIEIIKLDDSDDGAVPQSSVAEKSHASDSIRKLNIKREAIATNSLRDKLASKEVMKGDFIPRVAERYNERIEKRYKEAEELKRMTSVLAKHNRLQREAALEEQLAKSMRLYEAVLEEAEEEEEAALPELTPEMLNEVHRALIPRPPDEVLVDCFGLRVTRKDINTLSGLNWLNDEVINFYMNLLIERGNQEKYPSVYAMNTFFYPKLLSNGHSALKRWTRKVDIFSKDIVVVPVHLRMHWCMSIIDFRDKSIRYYDSMGGENPKCLQALRKYLEDESLDKKKAVYDTSDWTLESMSDIPQQMNGSDCGVFSCTFAEFICANRKITFSQEDMPYFRNKMVYEILKAKLL